MQVLLERLKSDGVATIGTLSIDDLFNCFVLEDAWHEEKIKGKTRIPCGTYKLHLKPLGSSHMDPSYTSKFGAEFHKGMIELLDVPNYSGVLIHIGNKSEDTEGCLLVGLGCNILSTYNVQNSTNAYEKIYPILRDALLKGTAVTLSVVDKDRPQQKE